MNKRVTDYPGENLAEKAALLLKEQKIHWELLAKNYSELMGIQTVEFSFPGYKIAAQFNAGRKISSTAPVDAKSISERKCFLCISNLPSEQKSILFGNYLILCNPFPIFDEHFTIAHKDHIPQNLNRGFDVFLDLTANLGSRYAVIYNGPECGASAPDHLHFQAVGKDFIPVKTDLESLKKNYGREIKINDNTSLFFISDGIRNFILIESDLKQKINSIFQLILTSLGNSQHKEPMLNLLSFYEDGKWRIFVFPRIRHRPSFYFIEGEGRILISPASIDMGGTLILPRRTDLESLTREKIIQIFNEVVINPDELLSLYKRIELLIK